VQLRDAERRLLGHALVSVNWDYKLAAASLGIGHRFLKARVIQLGGILPNTERNEPPPPIWPKKRSKHEAP
jgi:hypothetical protein